MFSLSTVSMLSIHLRNLELYCFRKSSRCGDRKTAGEGFRAMHVHTVTDRLRFRLFFTSKTEKRKGRGLFFLLYVLRWLKPWKNYLPATWMSENLMYGATHLPDMRGSRVIPETRLSRPSALPGWLSSMKPLIWPPFTAVVNCPFSIM